MAVTIKDIAKAAGVSYSTVSRALNNVGLVKDDKKIQIQRLAAEMGYLPNQSAINLKKARSETIGIFFSVINKDTSPFVLHQVLSGAYSVVETKYSIIVKGIDMQEPNSLNPSKLDGLIIVSQREEDDEIIQEAMNKKIPVVVINRPVFSGVSNILTDESQGIEVAMKYLLSNGHRKVGIIEADNHLPSSRARHRGWVSAVREYGLDPNDFPVEEGNYRFMSGYLAAKNILNHDLTAILCFNDEMALGARKAILERGLSVPEDISLIGFDNIDETSVTEKQLTTVERSMENLSRKGIEVLLQQIDSGKMNTERIYLDTKLVVRGSVKNLLQP